MGVYINQKTCMKEEWLRENSTPVSVETARAHTDFKENLLLCHVDNFAFTACGVAYSERERDEWLDELNSGSNRPMRFYVAPRSKIMGVINESDVEYMASLL